MFLSTLFRRLENLPHRDLVLREAVRQLQDWLGAESALLRADNLPRLDRAEVQIGNDSKSWFCCMRVCQYLLEFRHSRTPSLSASDREGLEKFADLLQELLDNAELSRDLFSLEEEVQDLIDTSLHLLASLSADGKIQTINQRQRTSKIGSPIWEADWLASESRPAVQEAVRKANEDKVAQTVMIRTARDSSYELLLTPLLDEGGEVSSLIIRGRDTSDRERMRDVLLEEREFLGTVLESIDEALIVCDLNARVTLVNLTAARRFGLEKGDPVAEKVVFLTRDSEGALPFEDTPFGRVLQGEQLRDVKCSCRDVDGDLRRMTASGRSLFGADGDSYGVVLALNDATQQLRAEQALVDSERQLRALFNFQPNAIFSLDPEGFVHRCNPAVESLLGCSPERLKGQSISSVMLEQVGDKISFQGEREMQFQRFDGEIAWGLVTTEVVSDSEGDLGIMWTVRDISERKKAELALDISNRRLATSREMERMRLARELHDGAVQNLLAVSYRMEEPKLREEVVEVVRQLRGLISDLRPPGLKEFGLAAALEGLLAKMERQAGDRAPSIELVCLGCDCLSESVSLCLFRVVQESINNALRHAQANQILIEIRASAEKVILRVKDDGVGFDVPEQLSSLTSKDRYGLAGMLERAELLGGTFGLTSGPQGTEVKLSLNRS
jgi:PAS domain S-box-containing protein